MVDIKKPLKSFILSKMGSDWVIKSSQANVVCILVNVISYKK